MKNILLLLLFSSTLFAQNNGKTITYSKVLDIVKEQLKFCQTQNQFSKIDVQNENYIKYIQGETLLMPYEVDEYYFEDISLGNNQLLIRCSQTYYSYDYDMIKRYATKSNKIETEEFASSRFASTRTAVKFPVSESIDDKNGKIIYSTKWLSYNFNNQNNK